MSTDATTLYCNHCERTLAVRQLRMQSVVVESCPYCMNVVRQTSGFSGMNLDQLIVEDIAAIDAWLDEHASLTGVRIVQSTLDNVERRWVFPVNETVDCEVIYSPPQTSIIQFRLTLNGDDNMAEDRRRVQSITASFGLQPHGRRTTDMLNGIVSYRWGVVQHLSTATLCEELFPALTDRSLSAISALQQEFED